MISAKQALHRLQEGNQRFLSGESQSSTVNLKQEREQLVAGQEPYAIIVACSDSRVPTELIFDQGLGDIFVVRVAGNIVTPTQIGSVEYAAQTFGTKLVVVLGHSMCGAVLATLGELKQPSGELSPNLLSIVEQIKPAVEPILEEGHQPEQLVEQAIQANIQASVKQLKQDSSVLQGLSDSNGLLIVGAEYSLATGQVTFYESK